MPQLSRQRPAIKPSVKTVKAAPARKVACGPAASQRAPAINCQYKRQSRYEVEDTECGPAQLCGSRVCNKSGKKPLGETHMQTPKHGAQQDRHYSCRERKDEVGHQEHE